MQSYFLRVKNLYESGELLLAEHLSKNIPANLRVNEDEQLLIYEIQKRLLELRILNIKGKPYAFCDPPNWQSQPKFEKTSHFIETNFVKSCCILDIGCFTGYLLRHLKQLDYVNLYGIDIHNQLMETLSDQGTGINFKFARAEDFNFTNREDGFDCITILDCLEHVFDDEAALDNCYAWLISKQGMLIINVPLAYSGYKDEAFEHLRMYTKDSLEELLKEIGFKDINFYSCKDEFGYDTLFCTSRALIQ